LEVKHLEVRSRYAWREVQRWDEEAEEELEAATIEALVPLDERYQAAGGIAQQ